MSLIQRYGWKKGPGSSSTSKDWSPFRTEGIHTYFSVIYTDVKYTSFFSSLESGVQYYICQDEFSQVMWPFPLPFDLISVLQDCMLLLHNCMCVLIRAPLLIMKEPRLPMQGSLLFVLALTWHINIDGNHFIIG